MITLKQVNKSFGQVKAINGLNLSISEGEVYALLGHNGAGKTTTLRLLLGLFAVDSGEIDVFGRCPHSQGDAIRKMCGVLSEDVGLYEPLTVYDNLRFYAEIYGMKRADYEQRIDELLSRFEISDKKLLPVKGFSVGMKKKVALIRAFLHKPRIILLDEPTNGLDPLSTESLRHQILDMAKNEGTTFILTTHNLDEVEKICDRITIMKHGQNMLTESVQTLKETNQDLLSLYTKVEEGVK